MGSLKPQTTTVLMGSERRQSNFDPCTASRTRYARLNKQTNKIHSLYICFSSPVGSTDQFKRHDQKLPHGDSGGGGELFCVDLRDPQNLPLTLSFKSQLLN